MHWLLPLLISITLTTQQTITTDSSITITEYEITTDEQTNTFITDDSSSAMTTIENEELTTEGITTEESSTDFTTASVTTTTTISEPQDNTPKPLIKSTLPISLTCLKVASECLNELCLMKNLTEFESLIQDTLNLPFLQNITLKILNECEKNEQQCKNEKDKTNAELNLEFKIETKNDLTNLTSHFETLIQNNITLITIEYEKTLLNLTQIEDPLKVLIETLKTESCASFVCSNEYHDAVCVNDSIICEHKCNRGYCLNNAKCHKTVDLAPICE